MTRQIMQDRLAQALGLEHPLVIWFCSLCEAYAESDENDECLFFIMLSLFDIIENVTDME